MQRQHIRRRLRCIASSWNVASGVMVLSDPRATKIVRGALAFGDAAQAAWGQITAARPQGGRHGTQYRSGKPDCQPKNSVIPDDVCLFAEHGAAVGVKYPYSHSKSRIVGCKNIILECELRCSLANRSPCCAMRPSSSLPGWAFCCWRNGLRSPARGASRRNPMQEAQRWLRLDALIRIIFVFLIQLSRATVFMNLKHAFGR